MAFPRLYYLNRSELTLLTVFGPKGLSTEEHNKSFSFWDKRIMCTVLIAVITDDLKSLITS